MGFFRNDRRKQHGFRQRSSIGSMLASPFRFLAGLFSPKDRGIGEQIPLHLLVIHGIWRVLTFPLWFLFHIGQFIAMSWTMTRSLPLLIPGLLPAGIGAWVVCVVFFWPFVEERVISGRYSLYRAERGKIGENKAALLPSKRLAQVMNTSQAKYHHAVTLFNAGLKPQAVKLMSDLTPLASKDPVVYRTDGFPEAHLFLAQLHFTDFQNSGFEDKKAAEDAERHLDRFAILMPNLVETSTIEGHLLRARLWQKTGKEAQAMDFFEDVAGIDPSVVPDLVKYLIANDRPEDARLATRRGLERLAELAQLMPENPSIWECMYQILVASDQYQQALDEFARAFQSNKDPSVRLQLLMLQSRAMMEYYEKLPEGELLKEQQERISLLSKAITAFPRNTNALSKFIDLALYNTNPEVNEWLSRLVMDASYPAYLSHIREGARLALEGKPEQSRKHFKLAILSDGVPAIVLTDMARILATEKGKPDDALKILDVASGVWDSPVLNAARGEILLSAGKPEDALVELEFAVTELPKDPEAWRLLAECREKLGDTEGAKAAKEKSEEARRAIAERNMAAQK